jgi:hypothetical protein
MQVPNSLLINPFENENSYHTNYQDNYQYETYKVQAFYHPCMLLRILLCSEYILREIKKDINALYFLISALFTFGF